MADGVEPTMITSFEVGAVFKIVNQASPAIRKILTDIRALNKAITCCASSERAVTNFGALIGLTSR